MILVTGGAGYIGTHTCVELLQMGHKIVVVDNFTNSHPQAIENVRKITGCDFPFVEMDVCNSDALDKVCETYKPTCIIHFAGLKAVGESVAKPLKYYQNNLYSTVNLLRAMEKYDIPHIIFSSSATVYSPANTMPLTEESTLGSCTNPYGWTKFMCEQIIADTAKNHNHWTAVLLRYFNPIGAHESGLIGEDPQGIPNNLVPYVNQAAAGIRPELPVTGHDYPTPDGTGVRDYLHICDLAAGHVAAVNFCKREKGTHAFNLGTGRGSSVLEIIHTFERANNVKVPYRLTDRRPGDIATCYADCTKAEKVLGWSAKKSLEDACRDLWQWQLAKKS